MPTYTKNKLVSWSIGLMIKSYHRSGHHRLKFTIEKNRLIHNQIFH